MLGLYILLGGIALGAIILMVLAVRADRKAHHAK
jgi:hypothetical protein